MDTLKERIGILFVEDDQTIASALSYALEQEGFSVFWAKDAREAFPYLGKPNIQLYLLDVLLPDGTGYDICKKVKRFYDAPVIFLTACDDEANAVMGLDLGADDYIVKPFRVRELISRIRSVLRRYQKSGNGMPSEYVFSSLKVSLPDGKVYKDDQEVYLSALEYKLLLYLIQNKGRIVTREQFLSHIFDISGEYVNDNTLTVYMKRLREKIEDDAANPKLVKTVRGLGYSLGEKDD